MKHDVIEKNIGLMIVLIIVALSALSTIYLRASMLLICFLRAPGFFLPPDTFAGLRWLARETPDDLVGKHIEVQFNDITLREPHDGYLLYQGGLPELEAFVRDHRK